MTPSASPTTATADHTAASPHAHPELRTVTRRGQTGGRPDPGAVLEAVFTTHGLPPSERLASFDRFLAAGRYGARVLSRHPDRLHARVRAAQLGAVEVSELTAAAATIARTPAHVRACDPDVYALVAPLHGRMRLSQAGRSTELRPGQLALRTHARPFELHVTADHGPARGIRVQVPRSLLPQERHQLDRLLATPIPGHTGIGRLFTQLVDGLAAQSPDPAWSYLPGDLPRLGSLTVEMFDAVLAHVLDREQPAQPRQQALLAQVGAFIREHLDDPDLSPETVASAHHISVSYLHRLFEGRAASVAATIRMQRLDRARRDLADPRLARVPIHRIASRWGFRDHTTFTRAFRARFGVPPRALRNADPTAAPWAS